MAKAKIQSKVSVLYDAMDMKHGKIVIDMEVVRNESNYTVTTNRYADNDGVQTLIKTKTFIKEFAEIDGLNEMIKPYIDYNLPYSERCQREEDLALLVYVQNDFIKDENGEVIPGKTICNLNPEDWEIANSYEVFKYSTKRK